MINTQEFLSSLLIATQQTQFILQQCITEASSHAMRSILLSQLEEYDQIETDLLSLSGRRGWEIAERQPSGRYLYRFHLTHRIHRTDSDLSERVIFRFTKDLISVLKMFHRIHAHDPMLHSITQKYLDCKTMSIQQLQSFL